MYISFADNIPEAMNPNYNSYFCIFTTTPNWIWNRRSRGVIATIHLEYTLVDTTLSVFNNSDVLRMLRVDPSGSVNKVPTTCFKGEAF